MAGNTRGSELLLAAGGVTEVARRLCVAAPGVKFGSMKKNVSVWGKGQQGISEEGRRLCFEVLGIDPEAWDQTPDALAATPARPATAPAPVRTPRPPTPEPVAPPEAAQGPAIEDGLDGQIARLRAQAVDPRSSAPQKLAAERALTSALRARAQQEREDDARRAANVDARPLAEGLRELVRNVLKPWPDAHAAFVAALDELLAKHPAP
jgi:hypothetical protein